MPQQNQYEGVSRPPEEDIQSTASAFDPKSAPSPGAPVPKSSFGALKSPEQLFSAGTLPSSGEAAAGIQDLMKDLTKNTVSDEDILKAITPVSGAAPAQIPPYYTRQLPQPGALIQDTSPVVGAGNARAQGIGNAINATIHGIAQFKAQRDQQQQLKDATKVQRLVELQNGITQAEQMKAGVKEGDPNYAQVQAEAKKTIDHNQGIMQEMLSDRKFSKLVEKGFNISLTDPSQNKTPEHGTVQHGINLFKKANNQPFTPEQAKAMSQRFGQQMPQQMQPNIMAQQMLQYKMQEQQQWQRLISSLLPRMFTARSTAELNQIRMAHQDTMQLRGFANQAARDGIKFMNDQAMVQTRHQYRLDEINAHIQGSYEAAVNLFQTKSLDPTTLFKVKTDFTQKMVADEARLNQAIAAVQGSQAAVLAAKQAVSNSDEKQKLQERADQLDHQYDSLLLQQKNLKTYKDGWYKQMQRLEEISAGGGGQSGPAGAASQQPGGGAGGNQSFNPDALLNNVPPGLSGETAGTGGALPPAGEAAEDDEDDEDIGGISYSPY